MLDERFGVGKLTAFLQRERLDSCSGVLDMLLREKAHFVRDVDAREGVGGKLALGGKMALGGGSCLIDGGEIWHWQSCRLTCLIGLGGGTVLLTDALQVPPDTRAGSDRSQREVRTPQHEQSLRVCGI